jgi:hypothetical protein
LPRLAFGGGGFFAVAGAASFGLLSAAGFGAGTFFAGASFGGAAFFFGGGTAGAARRGRGTGGESGEGDSGREGEQGLDVFHSKSKAWPGREISQKKVGGRKKPCRPLWRNAPSGWRVRFDGSDYFPEE